MLKRGRGLWAAALMLMLAAVLPCLGAAGEEGWYTEDGVYFIESFEGLEAFSRFVAQGEGAFTGEARLTADIFAERELLPIGSAEHMFCGTFDGNGHTISGLSIQGGGAFEGLFGYIGHGGCVRNLTLEGVHVSGTRYTGGIAAYSSGRIEGCRVKDGWIAGNSRLRYGTATGGIAGLSCGVLIECVNENTRVEGRRNVGGVVGSQCAGSIERCANTGNVRGQDDGEALVGGIAGSLQTGGKMRSCANAGSVYASEGTWVGGVTGGLLGGGMTGCVSLGEVRGREGGGVIGYAAQRAQVMCCVYAGPPCPGVGEGRQDGIFVLPGDREKIARAYELLKPLIEKKGASRRKNAVMLLGVQVLM